MKFEIRTNVTQGYLKRNRNLIIDALNHYEGKDIIITIEKAKKKRSNPQNNFYWGAVLPLIQQGLKDATGEFRTTENIHYRILLPLFAPVNEIVNQDTGQCLSERLSSSEMSTVQFMDYIMEIQKWAAEFLSIVIPDPNHETTLKFD